jgi:hypothetical protein
MPSDSETKNIDSKKKYPFEKNLSKGMLFEDIISYDQEMGFSMGGKIL